MFQQESLKQEILKILKENGIKLKQHLGQNFLISRNVLKKIIETADLNKNDVVLEVGPGLGILTFELIKCVEKLIIVEKDKQLFDFLQSCKIKLNKIEEQNKDKTQLEIIQGDILKFKPEDCGLEAGKYKVVANIPYYLTSVLIRKFLESSCSPKEMILMIQKEVAQRICAKPPNMSLLAVSVQVYAKPKIISYVSSESFWPKPNVDSAILKIQSLKSEDLSIQDSKFMTLALSIIKIAKLGFASPRKQILNNLSNGLKIKKEEMGKILEQAGINPKARPESLFLKDWEKIIDELEKIGKF